MERLPDRNPVELTGDYGPIDPKILNLVEAVNLYGNGIITTKASCQGHLDTRRLPFPWIGIWPVYHPEDEERLAHLKSINIDEITDPHRREFIRQERESIIKLIELRMTIDRFNSQSEVRWKLSGMYLEPEEQASNLGGLGRIQESANELAEYLKKLR